MPPEQPITRINAEAVNDRVKLLFHRMIARRLAQDPGSLDLARTELDRQRERYPDAPWLDPWTALLDQGVDQVRTEICRRTDRMTWLRISSPLIVLLDVKDPNLRRQIWRRSRLSLMRRAKRHELPVNPAAI